MTTVRKTDLKYHYSKTATRGDDPKLTAADRNLFNRSEEYEVIDMIQAVFRATGVEKEGYVHSIEDLIQRMPFKLRQRTDVLDWLIDQFSELLRQVDRLTRTYLRMNLRG